MRNDKPGRGRGFFFALGIGILLSLLTAFLRGGFAGEEPQTAFGIWSDAFFVAAVFVGGVSLLSFASADGLFDLFRFGVSLLFRVVLPKEKRDDYPKTYYEYRQSRGHTAPGLGGLLAGLVLLLLAGLFLWFSMAG